MAFGTSKRDFAGLLPDELPLGLPFADPQAAFSSSLGETA
jgi:hypothetical protein